MLSFDLEKCIKCSKCVLACGPCVIDMNEQGPYEKLPTCMECGHCVSVCPVDAIILKNTISADFLPVVDPQISFEQYNNLTRNRRSMRRFKSKPVDKSDLGKIMESVRYIPTGSNDQELKYLVITDKEIIQSIELAMDRVFRVVNRLTKGFLMKILLNLILGKKEAIETRSSLSRIVECSEMGQHPHLKNAPAVIIIYVKSQTPMAKFDSGIAQYHINLACETLGLGSCLIGFHIVLSNYIAKVRKISKIPKRHKVLGTIVLGHPDIKYPRTVARKKLDITHYD
ncbi:Heterodisulfide reductase, subunit A (polyferredoxin) [Candidatus Methanophagaceae archaeon]|nr:Heterodisulfide reductase, subunit A (polyferredoxin) [Methanophagales archaeon]